MTGKPYKHQKKGTGRHVQLQEWLQQTEAWRSLTPGPRALYIELKRRFNGKNNGKIYLSHRDAAVALNVHRNTVGGYFRELEERGLIRMTKGPHLGSEGYGKAAQWALCEMPTSDGTKADHSFRTWTVKKNPPHKNCA
jgi:DNA-binding transcriptional MocR family regulator